MPAKKTSKFQAPPSVANAPRAFGKPNTLADGYPAPGPLFPLPTIKELTEEDKQLISIIDSYNVAMRQGPYFMTSQKNTGGDGIRRYSDKYKTVHEVVKNVDELHELIPIKFSYVLVKKRKRSNIDVEIVDDLDGANEEEKKNDDNSDRESVDGSDEEEDNDYNENYFDPGDDYGDGDGGDDNEGKVIMIVKVAVF
ncbi:hypothetical protein O9G_004970 [Rozella allomycis CSF55]|uniref:DNA-directed RNA polymerase III subunit n=1 Tax=Rozella allomycis (strain CSF55) TaxID=988480 RepID=A0A075AMJ9_ROZAC|nr:hypothetical protein O9G_004970 [Rozella allomycis CSF55]|eukprot:EPZ30874.1 hypothetical protein O9G_004970 [Rozella allomycis CSF55]